ncbi:MAG: membrane protein insertion efficiency factor YidD, partial [Candidatus Omnitrophota bacterium]
MKYLKSAVIWALRFYRKYLSHMNIRCCRFYPSCSEYTIEAIEKDGIFSGSFKGF